ncbi:MAG TPA: rhomboid family intramembrane serine protease [Gammaproteobacteria bacterium]|jgi:membrane associated rhomboid family serine protease|nr:rhomboid family intramembrane serine protease [Gammaproteobacteria bacterium]
MDERAEPWVAVAVGLTEGGANELALVLIARGIAHRRQAGVAGLELWVPAAFAPVAAAELTQYRRENLRRVGERPLRSIGAGWPGVATYVAVLLVVFVATRESLFGLDWLGAGRLEAGAVSAGQWWRTVTALTLHIEFEHLGGNVAFGAFFGWFVGRYLGVGVGWLTVLAAGAGANALGAWLQGPEHRSLGASTAVFAALALLAAYTWRRGFWRDTPWRARIAPIVAGLGLLAFTGTAGENTDLGAHLFGFCAGLGAGFVLAQWLAPARLADRRVQRACAAAALVVVAAAWAWGLVAAG